MEEASRLKQYRIDSLVIGEGAASGSMAKYVSVYLENSLLRLEMCT